MGLRIAYLVHDLGDAAVARRVFQLREGGARVSLGGFFRRMPPGAVAGVTTLPLRQTRDGRLVQRALAVALTVLAPGRLKAMLRDADIAIARNLEMLIIAALLVRPGQRLVYECLDIHRAMLAGGVAGRVMRWIERRALSRTAQVLVSSPAFAKDYFAARQGWRGPVALIENKVTAPPAIEASGAGGPPWVLGWFGMLRCRRSLDLLAECAAQSNGRVRVLIAGIPSRDVFPDLPSEVARREGLEFAGPYSPEDLPRLYGRVHFAWCVDYFEEGLNSRWLLPNRLYESLAHGAVPVALEGVETGRWLSREGIGLRLGEGREIPHVLRGMTPQLYRALRAEVAALPRERIAFAPEDHRRLVRELSAVAG